MRLDGGGVSCAEDDTVRDGDGGDSFGVGTGEIDASEDVAVVVDGFGSLAGLRECGRGEKGGEDQRGKRAGVHTEKDINR